jgi:hypothetical protein
MTKVCVECKTENPNDAEFCQNCGKQLDETTKVVKLNEPTGPVGSDGGKKGFWANRSSGGKALIGIAGVICIGLILLIVIVGVFSPDKNQLNSKFSSAGLTFNYPSDWSNASETGDLVSGGTSLVKMGTYVSSSGLTLHVSRADLSTADYNLTVLQAKDFTKQSIVNGSSAQILSDNRTSVNGTTVYEVLYTIKDPNTNQDQKSISVVTGKNGQTVYYLQFIADTATFDDNKELINNVINTIKLK